MQTQLTEAEMWRTIGEAFEARAAHPELVVSYKTDIARSGMCNAVYTLIPLQEGDSSTRNQMLDKISDEVGNDDIILVPWVHIPEGAEARAMLAYLFAEEAAA